MIQLSKKKIFFITGSRAEFGIFENFLKMLSNQKNINLSLIITGSFLEKGFQNDFQEVMKSKLKIIKKIKLCNKSKDTYEKTSQDISLGIKKFTLFFKKKKPNYVIIPGDRYEMLGPSLAAFFLKIPIIHFYGGETTLGSFDNTIRDQISLMSNYHFVSNKNHFKKVLSLGINSSNIFNVGALGLEKLKDLKLFAKEEIQYIFRDFFSDKTALVTFHPVTNGDTKTEFNNLIKALDKIKKLKVIFTGPNNDPGHQIIIDKINSIIKKNKKKYFYQRHLGRKLYFSFVKNVDFNLGNSSSLLHEVPTLRKFSINIGHRQTNRLAGPSVISIRANARLILQTLNVKKYKNIYFFNPYFKKNSIQNAVNIIKKL